MAKLKIGNRYISNLKFSDMIFEIYVTGENKQFDFLITKNQSYIGTIEWGDGTTDIINESNVSEDSYINHSYSADGTYIIKVKSNKWDTLDFSQNNSNNVSYSKIRKVLSWGKYNNLISINFQKSSINDIPNECNALNIVSDDINGAFKGTSVENDERLNCASKL